MSIPPTTPTSVVLRAFLAACVFAPTYLNVASAQKISLPGWEESGGGGAPESSLLPVRGDIFQGGTDRPEIIGPSSPAAPSIASAGSSAAPANLGSVGKNIQAGSSLGALRGVANAGSSLRGGVGQIARNVQAGAQVAGAAASVGSALGQFQRGGSGTQGALGAIGNIAGVGQGQSGNLQGILQGLGGNGAAGAFGNGIGAGPFGQFFGQNNQILQGLQFVAALQQLLAAFFPMDSALQFNQSNTGQSARTAFGNLMTSSTGIVGGGPADGILGGLGDALGGPLNHSAALDFITNTIGSRGSSSDCASFGRRLVGALTGSNYFNQGLGITGTPYASMGGQYLLGSGLYRQLPVDPGGYQDGDTRIYQGGSGGMGHWETYYQGAWYSDHRQASAYTHNIGNYYSGATVYRLR